ncbi:MAG: RimK family alpha-L-glutamate ligase [Desulfatibacillaceae bacterium]
MSKPRIVLFAPPESRQAPVAAAAMERAGAEPVVLSSRHGPEAPATVSMGAGRLAWDGVDFSGVHAIHVVATAANTPFREPPVMSEAEHAGCRADFLREQLHQAALASFLEACHHAGIPVANRPGLPIIAHDAKGCLYDLLRGHGLTVPETLCTNDPAAAADFAERHGEVVVKPFGGLGAARVFPAGDKAAIESVRHCPVLLQRRVRGRTLRIHTVGDRIVLALDVLGFDRVDSRTSPKQFTPADLGAAHEEAVVRASRLLGMSYSAWDAILADSGDLYLLDANPGPYLLWLGERWADLVLDALAAMLTTIRKASS